MFTRVLVLVERSTAGRLLSWVRRLLAPEGGEVRLLAVLSPARAVVADGRTVVFADQDEDGRRRAAQFALSGFIRRLGEEGLGASADVRFGNPARIALQAAREWKADAIVIAMTPSQGWRRWLGLNVVDEILERSAVPVLVARATGQRAA